MSVPVAVVGASGYTGAEALRLLAQHPEVHVVGAYARRAAGMRLAEVFPQFAGVPGLGELDIEAFDPDQVAEAADIAFVALPHGDSARAVAALYERGMLAIDLSADFRLRDPAIYARWYGSEQQPEHPEPGLIPKAVYGLPERYRERLRSARLVACPGCYPTSAILPIAPLLDARLVEPTGLIVDAKTGVSGAGRGVSAAVHFSEIGEGVRAYKIAGRHRHTPEMVQELTLAAGATASLLFTPHLLPMTRGILACVYARPTDPSRTTDDYRRALVSAYDDEPFVSVLPSGRTPDTAHVRGSNRAHVAVEFEPESGYVLAMCAIDNLVKGSSGQAVQCMNLARGWPETDGLEPGGLFP